MDEIEHYETQDEFEEDIEDIEYDQEDVEEEEDYEITQYSHLIYKIPKNQYQVYLKLKFLNRYLRHIEHCINSYYIYDDNGNYTLIVWSFEDEEYVNDLESTRSKINLTIQQTKEMKNNHTILKKELHETYVKKCLHPNNVYKYITENDIPFEELDIDKILL